MENNEYQLALDNAKALVEDKVITKEVAEHIFPELRKPTDEDIKNDIIEDYKMAISICGEGESGTKAILQSKLDWVEKQQHWTPTKEQLDALEDVTTFCEDEDTTEILQELLKQLNEL